MAPIVKNNMSKYAILLKHTLYREKTHSPDELIVYSTLLYICSSMYHSEYVYITPEMLGYYIYGEMPGKKIKETISAALSHLISSGAVIGDKNLIKTSSVLKADGEYFATIPFYTLQVIMKSDYKFKKKLYEYLCWLLGSRNGNVGYQKIGYFADQLDVGEKTIIRYNEALEQLGIIYIARSSEILTGEYGVYRHNNVYGLLEHKEEIDNYIELQKIKYSTGKSANWLRSVSARYNAYIGGADLNREELYADCVKYNEIMDKKQKLQPGSDYEKKKKDLSVFIT